MARILDLTTTAISGFLLAGTALADTLDRLEDGGTLRLGYRSDAAPFAYDADGNVPAGYSVELCREVASDLEQLLGLEQIQLEYVAVTADGRFEALQDGRIDLLCGPTSATLSRREMVDFSIPTFVEGGSVLLPFEGAEHFAHLDGAAIGVLEGTTTEQRLRQALVGASINADVITVSDHDSGLDRLENGEFDAYFGDRSILVFLGAQSESPLRIAEEVFTVEPYALALPRGDEAFRLAVDRTLSRLYRSGEIERIFADAFGSKAEPGQLLRALYLVTALPE